MSNATKALLVTLGFVVGAGAALDLHHTALGGAFMVCAIVCGFTFAGIVSS